MSATVHQLATRRPVMGFDRNAIRQRNTEAFRLGDQARRFEAAAQLRALAAAVLNGEANDLLERQTYALIALFNAQRGTGGAA